MYEQTILSSGWFWRTAIQKSKGDAQENAIREVLLLKSLLRHMCFHRSFQKIFKIVLQNITRPLLIYKYNDKNLPSHVQ